MNSIPQIVQTGTNKILYVDNKPFIAMVEPKEGQFDFSLQKELILEARKRGLRFISCGLEAGKMPNACMPRNGSNATQTVFPALKLLREKTGRQDSLWQMYP